MRFSLCLDERQIAMKNSLGSSRFRSFTPLVLALLMMGTGALAADTAMLQLDAGAKWEVAKTTTLAQLTIHAGASISAPSGHSLTMTVNGVETAIAPGNYQGRVVLTPSKDLLIHFSEMGMSSDFKYRQGIYVNNGQYQPEQSVPAAVSGGTVSDSAANNINITSTAERFNGIIIAGNSTYTINQPNIRLTGNGKNDFAGVGAAVRAGDSSKVTINQAKINNTGAVRTAIWVGDNSETIINDSEIEVHDGVLPKNYGWSFVKGPDSSGTVMMEVPWMLGLIGNNRATLVTGSGIARYNHSHIKAQAWGAISTDAIKEGKVYLTKSHIETVDSGYGAFADGNSLVYSSGSTFDVADYGAIMGGGKVVLTDGSVVNSRRVGIMAHGGHGGQLTIDKGSIINSVKAAIQFKSSSPSILVDNAQLNSKSGVILQMMVNDDPNRMGGGGGAPGGAPSGQPAGAPAAMAANANANTTPGTSNQDLQATFKNVTLTGDFYNSLTSLSAMNLSFENAQINGAICTATAEHAVGPKGEKLVMQDATDLYYLIGEEKETCAETQDAHGASATLDARSSWVVAKTSYLTSLNLAPGAKISAPKGQTLLMRVNGSSTPLKPGHYQGKITLEVVKAK